MPLILLLAAVAAAATPAPPQRVSFATKDGWTIAALYRPPRRGSAVIVLAHGVGSSKAEWERLGERLAREGVGTLALDLRGHQDSRRGPRGPRGYEDFDATGEWPEAEADLLAAQDWLRGRGIPDRRIAFGGASIGANLASLASRRRPTRAFALLLSPGADYRGVGLTSPGAGRTLIAASPKDPYAYATMLQCAGWTGTETLSAPTGHGVQMLDDPATLERVAAWVTERARIQ